ncbi:MAG: hypothetical protein D6695_12470 [Planctomycetota bacterium]|nr:MAG: hypothetical protein D6695_12470 [Planctomycetota bacterium]
MAEPLRETENPINEGGSPPADDRPKIRHYSQPQPIPVSEETSEPANPQPAPPTGSSKIRTFEQRLGGAKHADSWNRTPNANGTGAIHVRSFHCKLTGDSLAFLDQQINEWLDEHPEYEVKFVTTAVGIWTGKLKEPNLIVNVWV